MHPIAPDKWFNDRIARDGGIFDRKSFDITLSACKQFRIALDIGAHVGTWSIGMSKRFQEVHAFEPEENNFRYLQHNIKDIPNIHPINIALGHQQKMVNMCLDGDNSGMSHVFARGGTVVGNRVLMKPLDDCGGYNYTKYRAFDKTTGAQVEMPFNIDLIKIDVEGYEVDVLLGATATIRAHKPVIMIEIAHGERYGQSMASAKHAMTELGYKYFNHYNKDYVYIPDTV